MKNSSGTIGNRNRDLPACSTVPPPTDHERVIHAHISVSSIAVAGDRTMEALLNDIFFFVYKFSFTGSLFNKSNGSAVRVISKEQEVDGLAGREVDSRISGSCVGNKNIWFVCWTRKSGSYVGHEYLVRMLDTKIWFVCLTRISGSYVGHGYLVRKLDTKIWFVCWTRISGSYVGHENLVRVLDTNIWFVGWTRISGSYVGHEYLVRMLDANIWFVCWTRVSGSYDGHEYLVRALDARNVYIHKMYT
jgi:hypothetical protein